MFDTVDITSSTAMGIVFYLYNCKIKSFFHFFSAIFCPIFLCNTVVIIFFSYVLIVRICLRRVSAPLRCLFKDFLNTKGDIKKRRKP